MTNRYSVTAMYSMAAEQDVEVEDELARGESAFLLLLEPKLTESLHQLKNASETSNPASLPNLRRTLS